MEWQVNPQNKTHKEKKKKKKKRKKSSKTIIIKNQKLMGHNPNA